MVLDVTLHRKEVGGRWINEQTVLCINGGKGVLYLGIAQGLSVFGRQEAGQAGELRTAHLNHPVVDGAGQMAQRNSQHFHSHGKGGGLKIGIDIQRLLAGHNAGVIRGGVQLNAQELLDVFQGVCHSSGDREAAAEGQRVLKGAAGVVLVEIAALQELPAPGGTGNLPRESAQRVDVLPHSLDVAVQALVVQAEDQVGHLHQPFGLPNQQGGHGLPLTVGQHDGVGVLQCPAVGGDALGLHGLDGGDDLPPVADVGLAGEGHADVGYGGDIRLTHTAPLGYPGGDAVVEEVPVQLGQPVRGAGGADEHLIQPDGHHGPNLLIGVVGWNAQGMAADDLLVLQLQNGLIHHVVLIPAHAPVKSIDGFPLPGQPGHNFTSLRQAFIGLGSNLHMPAPVCYIAELLQCQIVSV